MEAIRIANQIIHPPDHITLKPNILVGDLRNIIEEPLHGENVPGRLLLLLVELFLRSAHLPVPFPVKLPVIESQHLLDIIINHWQSIRFRNLFSLVKEVINCPYHIFTIGTALVYPLRPEDETLLASERDQLLQTLNVPVEYLFEQIREHELRGLPHESL